MTFSREWLYSAQAEGGDGEMECLLLIGHAMLVHWLSKRNIDELMIYMT